MMSFNFYTDENGIKEIEVTESSYAELAQADMEKVGCFEEKKLIVEDEEYEVNAIELAEDIRKKFLLFLEKERHKELLKAFKEVKTPNPTIKEVRESWRYVEDITKLYEEFSCERNIYFSYE